MPPSQGNFVLALFEDVATAKAAFAALRDKGLLVREMHGYGIPEGLRISIGLEEAHAGGGGRAEGVRRAGGND